MKKLLSLIVLIFMGLLVSAQAPQKFSYQAVVRDVGNNLVANRSVGVRISILQGDANGVAVYVEKQTVSTNANGLMTLAIGDGTVVGGDIAAIDWANGPYFLKTETDPAGGTNYTVVGSQQLLSVPYALFAANSLGSSFSGDYNDLINTPTIPTVPTNVSAFVNDANYVTIGQLPTVPTNVSAFTNDANYVTIGQLPTVPTNVSAFTNDAGYVTSVDVQQAANIPTNVSAFTNDAGYITAAQVPVQVNADWNATTGVARILNKPTIPTVPANVGAFTNDAGYVTSSVMNATLANYATINTIPTVPTNVSAFYNDAGYITSVDVQQAANIPTNVSAFTNDAGYITAAQVPAQVNADWNATSGVARILNKPAIPTVPTNISAFANDRGYITAASIPTNVSVFTNDRGYLTASDIPDQVNADWNATSGAAYIYNKPTIPTVPTNISAFTNDRGYITAAQVPDQVNADWNATSGAARILNKPVIPTVPANVSAFANDRGYITASSIPTNVSAFVNDRGYITASGVPTNVGAFENDVHYITEAQLNAILVSLNYTIDSLRERLTALETLPPTSGSVTTSTVTNVTENSAKCGGEVLTDGGSPIVERGVCWSTSHNPTTNNSHTIDGAGTGTYTSTITGLAANTTYYVRAYVVNSVGIGYGGEVSFTTLAPFVCGTSTVKDYDLNVYNTIQIGTQCWMKENMRASHYDNGTAISPYYALSGDFNNGYLYTWTSMMGGASSSSANPSGVQGVCPTGWHVPSDAEWSQLTDYVSSQSGYRCSSDSANIAKALAGTTGWNSSTTTCAPGNTSSNNNATGFSALPAGIYSSGSLTQGKDASFWSATGYSSTAAYYCHLNYNYATVFRSGSNKPYGHSVRCLRD